MVSLTDFLNVIFSKITALGASLNVTHYTLSLGAEDADTGWPAATLSAGTTITMAIVSRGSQQLLTGMGVHVKADVVGLTGTAVAEGDEIKDDSSRYYVVLTNVPHVVGDQTVFYEAQMNYQPLHD